ncbi:MAG TPA: S-layer homology domain-containing protein [Thermoanaerobaculia bacterium]|nr:S-layer homology domain-containing protein [Thermoanaerobaculia bacterium]
MRAFRRGGKGVSVFLAVAALLTGAVQGLLGLCGPFTDVAADAFCPFVLEIFYLGITTGTSPTTYDPTANVSRLQMAAFLSRTVDGVLRRGSRRAVLDQFWSTQSSTALGVTTLAAADPFGVRSDGADLWVSQQAGGVVSRVRGSDGKLLETWTGATGARGVLVAMGRVFVTGVGSPGKLYRIDPSQAAGGVTTVASNLGGNPTAIAFDGSKIFTANTSGSVSIVTPGATIPWTVTTVTTGFTFAKGMTFDGTNTWMTDQIANRVFKLDANGAILQTVTVGASPEEILYDGSNLWAGLFDDNAVTVIRPSTGAILATLTGNGMSGPVNLAFDGQRILVTDDLNFNVSLFKAADLTPLGSLPAGAEPVGACSDGISFWVTLQSPGRLARF